MQSLADATVLHLTRSSLRINATVEALHLEAGSWVVKTNTQSDHFDAVIVALPAHAAAEVLRMGSPDLFTDLANELASIEYTSSITVGLGYGSEVRRSLPPGFGFLVPRSESKCLLAATFVHNKFAHRAPEDRALLRCFVAGRNAENTWALSEDAIVGIVRSELQEILGPRVLSSRTEPRFARVYRWNSAMAQYGVGHLDRLERIERLRHKLPGFALAGNAYRGIGVPDCVRSGHDAAMEVIATKKDI